MIDGLPLDVRADPIDPLSAEPLDDRYQLVEKIGEGGFGAVFRATDLKLRREVAVKVLRTDDPQRQWTVPERQRFASEMRAAVLVKHPNVVDVYDYESDSEIGPYLVTELLEGATLAAHLRDARALTGVEILGIARQICAALAAVHGAGMIHLDLKPSNLFLKRAPESKLGFALKLLDFGIARATQTGMPNPAVGTLSGFTGSHMVCSPEQVLGRPLDHRSDLYSLGVLLFLLFTRKRPFAGQREAVLEAHLRTSAPRPSSQAGADWIPVELDRLILALLSKHPAGRPESVAAVDEELVRIRQTLLTAWAERFLVEPTTIGACLEAPDTTTIEASLPGELPEVSAPILTPRRATAVLVVDDEEAILDLIRLMLEDAGFHVDVASTGRAAVGHLADGDPPAAIVMDLLMPGMDGLSAIDACRDAGYRGLVVVCSSVRSQRVHDRVALGGCVFVEKGPKLHTLPAVLAAEGVLPE